MNNKLGVFLFTKDRPAVFGQTLKNIMRANHRIFIIDDSLHKSNQTKNEEITNKNGCSYLGIKAFQDFMSSYKLDPDIASFLLNRPGVPEWNLGYMRNFALLYAKSLKLEIILFMDDDITVTDKNLINELFGLTNLYHFTGAHISGMVDDSILGHIATALNKPSERTLSGGFMAFCPTKVQHYFLNFYNEDWIWLFLHYAPNDSIQTGEVFQAISDPLKSYKRNGVFQEFGERLLEAVMVSCHQGEHALLASEDFWSSIVKERNNYLTELRADAARLGRHDFIMVIDFIEKKANDIDAKILHHIFQNYFLNLRSFEQIYQSLSD